MKVGPGLGTISNGLEVTSKLTGTTIVEFDTPDAVMSTSPWHVVKGSPVVFTDTERVPGAVLVCGDTINQPLGHVAIEPAEVLVVAAIDTVAPVLVVRVSGWAGG